MTFIYNIDFVGGILEVRCPRCQSCAEFEHATVVRIERKDEIIFFENHPQLEYKVLTDSHMGTKWHAAIYYPLGVTPTSFGDLPPAYTLERWLGSRKHNYGMHGAIRCTKCSNSFKHLLNWPDEAYWAVTVRGRILWAPDRQSVVELHNFLHANDRQTMSHSLWLLRIPTFFKLRKNRDLACTALAKMIGVPSQELAVDELSNMATRRKMRAEWARKNSGNDKTGYRTTRLKQA